MALNAYWGNKLVIIVSEQENGFASSLKDELNSNNFNNVEVMDALNYAQIAESNPAYVLVVEESSEHIVKPFRTEGFVSDRLGHYAYSILDRKDAKKHYAKHFGEIKVSGAEIIDFELVKDIEWYYDDKNYTPFLKLEVPNTKESVVATCESIKDYFRP